MERLSTEKYQPLLEDAVRHFWETRDMQAQGRKNPDQGSRSSVTGGKQLDGFIHLLAEVAKDQGVPQECIYTRGNSLPGFFRPAKDWDFVILSRDNQLIAVVEMKSQVGSFGNNFNNRAEEALGSALDLWTAFREKVFPQTQQPWLGYMMLVEKTMTSTRPVRLQEPHFRVLPEFVDSSYLDRYAIFCQKLMRERHYTSTALIWANRAGEFACPADDISFDAFLLSFMGFLQGKAKAFGE